MRIPLHFGQIQRRRELDLVDNFYALHCADAICLSGSHGGSENG